MALRHLGDFVAVHEGKGDSVEALDILRDSLGLGHEQMTLLAEEGSFLFAEDDDDTNVTFAAGILLGLILGAIAADYASET